VEYEQAIIAELDKHQVEWLALAGYMKIVGPTLLARYPQRIINIHPSLLPSFPGLHAQRQALEYGVKVAGCTVHFVDAGVDTGPIIGQRSVAVHPRDTEDTLSARILEQEHQLYAESLKRVTELSWRIEGRTVVFD
jgi:phosphoribosylglycinamide formyltransferase-1